MQPDILCNLNWFKTNCCFGVCGSVHVTSPLSWLVCAPGRETSTPTSVRQVDCVLIGSVSSAVSHVSLIKLNIKERFAFSLSSHSPLVPCPSLFLCEPFVFDRAPQRAVIMQKRRRWKVGKVLVQLSRSLPASFSSLYSIFRSER